MCFKKQSTDACLRVYVLNIIVAWEHTVSMCVCTHQVCCTICKKIAFGWRDSTAPSDWWADLTLLPQQLLHGFHMERGFCDMVAVVSMGFCRRAAVWLPGVSQSVYQSFSHLHTLLSIITSCTFPITPCTLLQLILPISNEISALLVCTFFSPHWTQYEMKPVLCKRVCGRDKRVLSYICN